SSSGLERRILLAYYGYLGVGRPRFFIFFFFQAEDGIRDFHVTGVQTCALPISAQTGLDAVVQVVFQRVYEGTYLDFFFALELDEIGRASCRERVEIPGVEV